MFHNGRYTLTLSIQKSKSNCIVAHEEIEVHFPILALLD
jgi:hypothetical protein